MTYRDPSYPALAKPDRSKSRAFILSGMAAIAITALAAPLGLLDWLPFIGPLLSGRRAVGTIAVLVLALSLWVVLFVLARMGRAGVEQVALQSVRLRLTQQNRQSIKSLSGTLAGAARTQVRSAVPTLIERRMRALETGDQSAVGATGGAATRSELDHARSEVSYGPARALIWALPALGFIGTAAEMSRAVGGLGNTVGKATGYGGLRDALVSDVIPPLADAFGVTLFALGASVLCHLLLTWANSREQRVLLDVEEVTLEALTKASGPPAAPADVSSNLNGQLGSLTTELGLTRQAMQHSAAQVATIGSVAELGQLLSSIDQRLSQVHAELSRDLVLTRMYQPGRS